MSVGEEVRVGRTELSGEHRFWNCCRVRKEVLREQGSDGSQGFRRLREEREEPIKEGEMSRDPFMEL